MSHIFEKVLMFNRMITSIFPGRVFPLRPEVFLCFVILGVSPVFAANDSKVSNENYEYQITVGDGLNIFVWRNPELSMTVPVRPDGRISLPLVNELTVVGKTPEQLREEITQMLAQYIKQPVVSVIVTGFGTDLNRSIKIIGGKLKPISLPYINNLRLLDVLIRLGGIPENAAGNRAKILREQGKSTKEIEIDLDDLLEDGDMSQNLMMRPGDVVVIPEKWF